MHKSYLTLMTGFVLQGHGLNTQVHVWLFVNINRAELHLDEFVSSSDLEKCLSNGSEWVPSV